MPHYFQIKLFINILILWDVFTMNTILIKKTKKSPSLSRCFLQFQKFFSPYDITITYIASSVSTFVKNYTAFNDTQTDLN